MIDGLVGRFAGNPKVDSLTAPPDNTDDTDGSDDYCDGCDPCEACNFCEDSIGDDDEGECLLPCAGCLNLKLV